MPIYEYECNEQGHRFEKWQSIQDEPIKTCPVCGSPVHKIFHPAGIIFKGSGWYITDSRKSSSAAVSGEGKSEDKSKSTKDEGTKSEPDKGKPTTEKKD